MRCVYFTVRTKKFRTERTTRERYPAGTHLQYFAFHILAAVAEFSARVRNGMRQFLGICIRLLPVLGVR